MSQPDLLWDNPRALVGHFTMYGFVALRCPHAGQQSGVGLTHGVGLADDRMATAMLYRNGSSKYMHDAVRPRSDNPPWVEVSWDDLIDSELRSAYSLLVKADKLPRIAR